MCGARRGAACLTLKREGFAQQVHELLKHSSTDAAGQNCSLIQRKSAGPERGPGKEAVQSTRRSAVQRHLKMPLEAESIVSARARIPERHDRHSQRAQGVSSNVQHSKETWPPSFSRESCSLENGRPQW